MLESNAASLGGRLLHAVLYSVHMYIFTSGIVDTLHMHYNFLCPVSESRKAPRLYMSHTGLYAGLPVMTSCSSCEVEKYKAVLKSLAALKLQHTSILSSHTTLLENDEHAAHFFISPLPTLQFCRS